jgi:CBS domain-containing protein
MNVKQILAIKGKGVITINPQETIEAAILKMEKHNIGSLIVLDENEQMVGILTERHIVRQAPKVGEFLSKRVEELMEPNVITGTPQDDLQALIHIMTEKRIRHLPICEQGKLYGLISVGDVLKTQRDLYQGQAVTLETQLMTAEWASSAFQK